MYFNCCCSCSFKHEIIKIGQSSHKMYSNKILNFQESTTILNACTKKSGNLLNAPILPYTRRVEFFGEEVILLPLASIASLFVYKLRFRQPFERMYVKNYNCDS